MISDTKESFRDRGGTFSNNTRSFNNTVLPYLASGSFENNPQCNGGEPFTLFRQTGMEGKHIEGWSSTEQTIYSFIVSTNGVVSGMDLNFCTNKLGQSAMGELLSKGIYVYNMDIIASDRYVFSPNGVSSPGGGGGEVIPELDFSVGGIWNPRSFENIGFDIIPVLRGGFLPRRRPPNPKSLNLRPYSMKRNQRATLFVIGIDGTKWMATTDFMLESVQRVNKLNFEKVSSFDGSTIEFTCEDNQMYNFSGKLLDAKGFDQARSWVYNWERYLDANILARNQSRIMLLYKDKIITGYILGFQSSSTASNRFIDTLSFNMYVSDYNIGPKMIKGEVQDQEIKGQYYRDKDNPFNDSNE